ncbi:MAG: C1 family peptidase [Candidatus Methanofastidiosia archaeon]|jgi:C1A family cysteine protease
MKGTLNEMRAWFLILIICISFFPFLSGSNESQIHVAPKREPAYPPIAPSMSVNEIREMINQNRLNYRVGETWVSRLPPDEMIKLLGYRPPLMDLSHLSVPGSSLVSQELPLRLDYRDRGIVTPPKDQAACGSCWCFAGIGATESKILDEGGPEYDLSEENVLSCNFFGAGCDGGDDFIVANNLIKYGASLESCAPYDATDGTPCNETCDIMRKLRGWHIIGTNLDSEDPSKIETVKQALSKYGPLFVSMDASAPGFSAYTGGVFEYWGSTSVNHAVLLIGWDDSLVHSRGTGAWIVKNNWGPSWGESGYFNIAYGSAKICEYVSAFCRTEEFDDKKNLYYYDEGGWLNSYYSGSAGSAYGAVRFVPTTNGVLERVEFWAVDKNITYSISIYDTMTPSAIEPGEYDFTYPLINHIHGVTAEKAGYHSVELPVKPRITAGDDIIIAMRFTSALFDWPGPIDDAGPPSGESYASTLGHTWFNLSDEGHAFDVGIRAVVQEEEELIYDDGSEESSVYFSDVGGALAVKCSVPQWTQVSKLKYFIGDPQPITVYVLKDDLTVLYSESVTPSASGWFEVDVYEHEILVNGDFYVAAEYTLGGSSPYIGLDTNPPDNLKSYYGTITSLSLSPGNLMIRAIVKNSSQPDDMYEENDRELDAAPIAVTAGNTVVLPDLWCGDEDYFKVYLEEGDSLFIEIDFIHENGDLDLYLWDAGHFNAEIRSYSNTDGEMCSLQNVVNEKWYNFEVVGFCGAKNSYSISVTVLQSNFSDISAFFDTNSFFVAGDQAYCTDVLGSSKIAFGLRIGGVSENPEGRTDVILTSVEHDTGNLIIVGGPAVNPVATEFDEIFGINYYYEPGIRFDIYIQNCMFCEPSISLDITQYPSEDICIVYLGDNGTRKVMVVWGFGWQGTYAGSAFIGDSENWQTYSDAHWLMLRWIDENADGLVQMSEIVVEHYA